jgi:RimJ/RimL family protein N-acetyltransferase
VNAVIETDRLLLRRFTREDAPLLFTLNMDPEVTRYTMDPMTSLEQAKQVLEETILPQYALYDHGRWAVHIKPGQEFIGWCGLKFRADRNEIDLGYRFMKGSWGYGYATESARACIQYGFTKLDLKQIIGRALPGNQASIKVLEKCGMSYICEEVIEGWLHKTYQISNPAIPS